LLRSHFLGRLTLVELSAEDRALLAFECAWWTEPGLKTDRIRRELGISSSTYYKRLNELIDAPEALEFDPLLVRRLRRRRAHDDTMPATGRPQH
jgi:hypothetical protein